MSDSKTYLKNFKVRVLSCVLSLLRSRELFVLCRVLLLTCLMLQATSAALRLL